MENPNVPDGSKKVRTEGPEMGKRRKKQKEREGEKEKEKEEGLLEVSLVSARAGRLILYFAYSQNSVANFAKGPFNSPTWRARKQHSYEFILVSAAP